MNAPIGRGRARGVATATSWPEADALFRSDDRWLGSDDAYSIELAPGRILWLFGDTFVGRGRDRSRSSTTFIHNSIGIQTGSDPARASMRFCWADRDGVPQAFFPAPEGMWYWPMHGALAGGRLLVFVMLVRSPAGGTGTIDEWRRLGSLGFFDVVGWAALAVSEHADDPHDWSVSLVAKHEGPLVIGASVVADGEWLYAFAWDPLRHICLARWPVDGVDAEPEWWTGTDYRRGATPAIVIQEGATEFTIHRDATSELWCQTQVMPSTGTLAIRRAQHLQGPWSDPSPIFTPEETARPEVFVYAGKAHPHLQGADLTLTYASISEADRTLADDSIYYPRFVRATMEQ